jgi:predicted dehydrogenase
MHIGLIGCGMAGSLRAAAAARLPGFRLSAVSDVDAVRARAVAERFGAAVEPEWAHLVRREDIDAVIVSTPPPLHRGMCIDALRYGKHVLCEKPLARSPEECLEMVHAAEQAGRVLATGFNYRFYPAVALAKRILDSGQIGDLDHVRSYAGHPGAGEFTHPWVHDPAVMGGGALMDNGIHIVDLTRYFLGGVVEVKGFTTGRVWQFEGCEDNGFALLRNPAGNVAVLQASWTEWRGYRFWIEVYGTRGCVRASYPPMVAQVVGMEHPGQPARRRLHVFPMLQVMERLRSYRWTAERSFVDELAAFARAVRGERTPLASGRDGLKAVEIAYAVYRTAESGRSAFLEDENLRTSVA